MKKTRLIKLVLVTTVLAVSLKKDLSAQNSLVQNPDSLFAPELVHPLNMTLAKSDSIWVEPQLPNQYTLICFDTEFNWPLLHHGVWMPGNAIHYRNETVVRGGFGNSHSIHS